jgi:hypothetical protein
MGRVQAAEIMPLFWFCVERSDAQKVFQQTLRDVFHELDKILEPDFIETTPQDADLLIISSAAELIDPSYAGYYSASRTLYPNPTSRGAKFGSIVWRDYDGRGTLSNVEMSTLVHEIGHGLGLSHPVGASGEDGYNQDWDASASIMSYNSALGVEPVFFRPHDTEALKSIWGAESVVEVLSWPATESYPAVISSLPYIDPISLIVETIGGTETTTGGTETATGGTEAATGGTEAATGGTETATGGTEGVTQLSSTPFEKRNAYIAETITNSWWLRKQKKRIGQELELDILVDYAGAVKESRKTQKLGTPQVMSAPEVAFIEDLVNQISSECRLSVNFVVDPSGADIILSSKAGMTKYDAYYGWAKSNKMPHRLFWVNNEPELTVHEQNLISASILASIGFKEIDQKGFSTFDTIMSWNDREYYGLTAVDKLVLREMWGEPV